jgi:hypothetical protein
MTDQRIPPSPYPPPYPPQGHYPPQPQKPSHTLRNVLLVLGLLFVLFVGGCMAVVAAGVDAVDDAVKAAEAEDARPGGPDNPLEIVAGEPFEVDGFNYEGGWEVRKNALGSIDITGFKVENNRKGKDSAFVDILFMRGSEVLATTSCTTAPIAVGQTVTLSCLSADKLPTKYDAITISDTF